MFLRRYLLKGDLAAAANRAKASGYPGEQLLPKPQTAVLLKCPVLTQKLCGSTPALHSSHGVVCLVTIGTEGQKQERRESLSPSPHSS